MSNLSDRLRDQSWRHSRILNTAEMEVWDKTCCEAADRIADLEAENERLQVIATAAYSVFSQREAGACADARLIGWEELEVALSSGPGTYKTAIDENERLDAENKRLREALADCMMHVDCENLTTQTLHANWQAVLDGKLYNRGTVRVD